MGPQCCIETTFVGMHRDIEIPLAWTITLAPGPTAFGSFINSHRGHYPGVLQHEITPNAEETHYQ